MSVRIPSPDWGSLKFQEALKPRNQFSEFCEETTLNGWYYLAKKSVGRIGRSYWALVVLGSLVLSGFFIYGATNEFLDSTVIITVDSVTASLDKVLFPSLVVCNQNQVPSIAKHGNKLAVRPSLYEFQTSTSENPLPLYLFSCGATLSGNP